MVAVLGLPFYFDRLQGFSFSGQDQQNSTLSIGSPQGPEVISRVYKWQDADGIWQYSDAPPPEGVAVETLSVSNQTNIIQSVAVPAEQPASPREQISEKSRQRLEEAEQQDLLSLDRAKNIMDEAKAVQELMNTRNQQLNNLSGTGD